MSINNNHCNLAFDREIDSCRDRLQAKVFDACGYPSAVLLDRLMQRLVEISRLPYTLSVSTLYKTTSNCFPAPGTKLNCDRAFMEIGSGRITITSKQWLANQLDFFLHWAFCLIAILTVKKAAKNKLPAVLVLGVGEESLFKNGSDEQFVTYCRVGPIEPLRSGKRFLVQSVSKSVSTNPLAFVYSRRPLVSLLCETKIGFFGRLRLLVKHIILFFAYHSAVFRLPQLSLLGKDFAYSSISFELDRCGLIESIVLTCGNHPAQPLWTRALLRAKVHMIWYSQAAKQIIYASDKLDAAIPNYRWIRVDAHWVWTHAFAEYLNALIGHTSAVAVGPIVWCMPEITPPAKDAIEIAIFDVSPYSNEIAFAYGEIPNYNHPDNLFSFIQDVISLKSGLERTFHLPVSFRLKTKRWYNAAYDRAYFDYLEKLRSLGAISLEHHATNVYSLISSSHLVIVYPFSSPAYIADHLSVPSIYYDPTRSILRDDFGDSPSLIKFANSPEALLDAAVSALSSVFSKAALTH